MKAQERPLLVAPFGKRGNGWTSRFSPSAAQQCPTARLVAAFGRPRLGTVALACLVYTRKAPAVVIRQMTTNDSSPQNSSPSEPRGNGPVLRGRGFSRDLSVRLDDHVNARRKPHG